MIGPDQIIFRAGGRAFTYRDALRAADHRGALEPARAHVRTGVACQRYADDEGFAMAQEDLDAASDSYRYDADLTTAEDTERWLGQHGLALDDFVAWLERRHWARRFEAQRSFITRHYVPGPGDVDNLLWPELVFGGFLESLAHDLAALVASRLAAGPVEGDPAWADDVAALHARFEERRQALAAPECVERECAARAQALVRFEVQLAAFASFDAAREAWLCGTEDGEPLGQVAGRGGGTFREQRVFLDELPAALQRAVASARPGELIRPVSCGDGGGVVVCRVSGKHPPEPGDHEVRERIESALLERGVEGLVREFIHWA
jgi:hypothetical protein